ncbi:hypothetical protein DFH06DRAFT_1411823 [Mycena polygramma]|nr:hypothetical protein DFH06DRAFT_1411823 [Mycena polygramma]
MASGRRSLQNPTHPVQGSAFHELVVAPTLTPEMARPYQIPGTTTVITTHLGAAGPPQDTPSAPTETGSEDENAAVEGNRLLYVHVTLEWTERAKSSRTSTRSKKFQESKLVGHPVDVLSMTRVEFIPVALGAHQYEKKYVAGFASGPLLRAFYAGSPGGKSGAAVIAVDSDWKIVIEKLSNTMKTSPKLDTICVVFDLDLMDGFLRRAKRIHSPDPHESNELSFGSYVPSTDNFTPAEHALASAVNAIKAAHFCKEHGTCFIGADGEHVEMNRFRLTAWEQAVGSGHCEAKSPPPSELLSSWTGGRTSSVLVKPRGRSGPHAAVPPASTSTTGNDTAALLLTTVAPMMAMVMQNLANNTLQPAPPAPAPLAPPRSPAPPSSPPPAVEDELDVFMGAFRRAKKLSDAIIDNATSRLRENRYSVDILSEASVTSERLQELTGLAEGEVHQLKKFARQWSGKMEGKRARRGISF